ncbi:MAG: WecB/TagA/CpsF family glycosyltransferase [Candidatus Sericytochromatia bacterium]|nr:WecB/TagA/CpsF family glycosyltransferase [Candidatus Sericytochromatia bacterium]
MKPYSPPRLRVTGLPLDTGDADWAAAKVREVLASAAPSWLHVVTMNAEMAIQASGHQALARIIGEAGLVLPDGSGVVWAAARRGVPVRKLAGVAFVDTIAASCAATGKGLYLLGAAPGVAAAAAEVLRTRHPGLTIAGTRDGYFTDAEEPAVIEGIRASGAAALLVALGVPRQELWIDRHRRGLGVRVAMGIGGSLDVISGRLQRAPGWMIRLHLEWLYRLVQEPWRWQRMATLLPRFIRAAVAAEKQERYTLEADPGERQGPPTA